MVFILAFLLFAGPIVQTIGEGRALSQRDFLVLDGTPNVVVVRIYDDVMLAAQVDTQERVIQRQIIRGVRNSVTTFLPQKNIGPFKRVYDNCQNGCLLR